MSVEAVFLESFSKVIEPDTTIVLAVSGGVDSMVMLDLVRAHHRDDRIIVAHFDHSLRGADSDGDREFVANICKSENIAFEYEKLDIAALATEEKMSIESSARKYRYEFLTRVAEKYRAAYILTAHHLDDRIETALFHLIRGTKLGGIHALSECTVLSAQCRVYRPLLRITKSAILEYAREKHIDYREDATNASTEYQRNYLRHEVLPLFEKVNPEYRRALSNLIDYTEELQSWIDREVERFLGGGASFSVSDFEAVSLFFQKEIVRYLYESANSGTIGLTEGNIEEVLRYILTANGGTKKELGKL